MSAYDPKRTQGSVQRYLISSARSPILGLPDLARDVRLLDRNRGSAAKRNEEDQGTEDSCTKARGETMIRTENLRGAFHEDDVDEYLYKLLPGRDAGAREREN